MDTNRINSNTLNLINIPIRDFRRYKDEFLLSSDEQQEKLPNVLFSTEIVNFPQILSTLSAL